jgi:tripartite-type tricarboxylate transporter receptor subunit TctC
MKFSRRTVLHLATWAVALPAVSRVALAQTYPVRPITVIVPAPAGGPLDAAARLLSERMRNSLAQPLLSKKSAGPSAASGSRLSGAVTT